MFRTPPPRLRSATSTAAVLTSIASLAACSDATGPQGAAPASSPRAPAASLMIIPPATEDVRFTIRNDLGGAVDLTLGKTSVRFDQAGGAVHVVTDNGSTDLDPTPGAVRVRLPWAASYAGCVTGTAADLYAKEINRCRMAYQGRGTNAVSLGAFTLHRMAWVKVELRTIGFSGFGYASGQNAAYSFTNTATGEYKLVHTNGTYDYEKAAHAIIRTPVVPGSYKVCEVVPLSGNQLDSSAPFGTGSTCRTVNATAVADYNMIFGYKH